MNTNRFRTRTKKPRIFLSERDLDRLFEINATQSVARLAERTGLPYMLIYNIVHRRVRSVSHRHYTMLFGSPAPAQVPLKVDGKRFRAMVDLWLYLNDGLSRAQLYRELYGRQQHLRVDHRIFSGKINSVDFRLDHAMRQKYFQAGLDESILDQWLNEFSALSTSQRVPYAHIRPTLTYLKKTLGLHPTTVLKQSVARYESGKLTSVPRHIADHAEALKQSAQAAIRAGQLSEVGKIRESILGGKTGYTLYTDIREELHFVIKAGGPGAKSFLGRSRWTYEQGKARHVANWRVSKIMNACDRIIQQRPTTTIATLPPSRRRRQVQPLLDVLMARSSLLLSQKEGIDLEKRILRPARRRDEYSNPYHGFTPFDMAPRVLGMRRRAFDLMVTENREIFQCVGRFSKRWLLSDLYLRELTARKDFKLILAKYERLARDLCRRQPTETCLI